MAAPMKFDPNRTKTVMGSNGQVHLVWTVCPMCQMTQDAFAKRHNLDPSAKNFQRKFSHHTAQCGKDRPQRFKKKEPGPVVSEQAKDFHAETQGRLIALAETLARVSERLKALDERLAKGGF